MRRKIFLTTGILLFVVLAMAVGAIEANTTITFWNGFTSADGDQMREIVSEWNRLNPDKQVEMQVIIWGTFYDKLTTSLATGTGPDIAVLHVERMPYYVERNLFLELDDFVDDMGLQAENFVKEPWDAGVFDGIRYSLPLDWMPFVGLYYNRDHYVDAGLDPDSPPTTAEEFVEYSQRLTTGDRWGYMVSRTTPLERLFLSLLFQNGGAVVNDDFTDTDINGPEGLAALQFIVDTIYEYKIAPLETAPDEEGAAFKAGRVTHVFHHLAAGQDFATQDDLNFSYAPMPVFGNQQAVFANSHQIVLPRNRQNDPEKIRVAMEFIEFLLTEKAYDWVLGGQLPVNVELLESPEVRELPLHSAQIDMAPYLVYPPMFPEYGEIHDRIRPAVESAIVGLRSPQEALDVLAGEIRSILARR